MRDLKSRTAAILSLNKAIRLFNQGDAKAFEFIYRSYCDFVHRICLRLLRDPVEAEDAAQDVFVCLLCKINTFRGESAFSSWLYRLTANSVLMRFRKKKHTWIPLEEPREDEGGSYRESGAPDSNLSGLLDRLDLQSAVDVLPNGYKTAFVLHDVQGYDHSEIAEMFGYSIGNSKSQLHKARRRLRQLLGGMPSKGEYSKTQNSKELVLSEIAKSAAKRDTPPKFEHSDPAFLLLERTDS
jgi:RNA polymerase sigma-70 factor, ECF subfamily